jgi:predicted transcriptional regulator
MDIRIDERGAEAKSRLVHLSLLNLNLRLMEHWRSLRFGPTGAVLDTETLLILMAIIVIKAEKLLRSGLDPDLESFDRELPRAHHSRVNLSSIASATSINRETVRRKVNRLEEDGMITRDKEGIQIVPGGISLDDLRNVLDAQLQTLVRTVNQLIRIGVLSEDASNRRRASKS